MLRSRVNKYSEGLRLAAQQGTEINVSIYAPPKNNDDELIVFVMFASP